MGNPKGQGDRDFFFVGLNTAHRFRFSGSGLEKGNREKKTFGIEKGKS
jgi:hypothetical protein